MPTRSVVPAPALSIRQPWASLILAGYKQTENRTWQTRYRGPVLIHAGKRVDVDGIAFARSLSIELDWPALPAGGIIGRVELVDCVTDEGSPWAIPGQFHWLLRDPRPLPFRPLRGQLGLFAA